MVHSCIDGRFLPAYLENGINKTMKKKKLVFKELIEDIKSRDKKGWEIYKKPMTTFDGRNSLQDAYEEALDLVVYLKKFLLEQDNPLKIIDQIAKENYKPGFIEGSKSRENKLKK
jgi:hypothetical protein